MCNLRVTDSFLNQFASANPETSPRKAYKHLARGLSRNGKPTKIQFRMNEENSKEP
jgi:hypothetical protein